MSALEDVMQKANGWTGIEKLSNVQDILNKNKLLISQIQHNHEIRTPDSLQHNAVLIRELNNNIGQIVKAYHELSVQEDFVRSQPQ
jgi:hypothetical protein